MLGGTWEMWVKLFREEIFEVSLLCGWGMPGEDDHLLPAADTSSVDVGPSCVLTCGMGHLAGVLQDMVAPTCLQSSVSRSGIVGVTVQV